VSDGHTQAEFDNRVAMARSIAAEEMAKWSGERVTNAQKKLRSFFYGKDEQAICDALFLCAVCHGGGFKADWAKTLIENEQARRRMLYVDKFIAARKNSIPPPAPPSSPV